MNTIIAFTLEEYLKEEGLLVPGVRPLSRRKLDAIPYFFGQRYYLEERPQYKQIIPYCIIYESDPKATSNPKLLTYKRSRKGQERRLHDLISIGFGGHITPLDIYSAQIEPYPLILTACYRELEEELPELFYNLNSVSFGGKYIYDNTTEVNAVHWGVLCTTITNGAEDLAQLTASTECSNLEFRTLEELANCDSLETWSKLVVEELRNDLLP